MSAESFRLLVVFPIAVWLSPALVVSMSGWKGTDHPSPSASNPPQFPNFQSKLNIWVELCIYLATLITTFIFLPAASVHGAWSYIGTTRISAPATLGSITGLAWFWLLVMLLGIQRLLVPNARLIWEIPALLAHGPLRPVLVVLVPVAIEFWRCATITALIRDGISGTNALIVCMVAYVVPFASRNPYRAAHAVLEGFLYGILFLWQQTFVAPVTAHLVFGIGMIFVFRRASGTAIPFQPPMIAACPQCRGGLTFGQIKWDETFICAHCGQLLSIVNWRRTPRLILGLSSVFLFCTLVLVLSPEVSFDRGAGFVLLALGTFAANGLVILIQFAISPKLEPGDPEMPSLNLTRRTTIKKENNKNPAD